MIFVWIAGAIVLIFGFVVFFGAPYVPSQRRFVRKAFEDLYPLDSKDVLVDIGSGDGLVLRQAAAKGARAVGFELNPVLVFLSRWLSRREKRVHIVLANFWLTPLPDDTTVVYSFGVGRDVKKLTRKLQYETERLGRPISLLSFGHQLPIRPTRELEPYFLYRFEPLHSQKAQV